VNGRLSCSLIIPCWNDGTILETALDGLTVLSEIDEIIVADASDDDRARSSAAARGAIVVRCERPSRGRQLNAGARVARGDLLLFHHADTILTQAHVNALHDALVKDPLIGGGAFHRKFDDRHARLRLLEGIARQLAIRGGTLYGDQSIFVRREWFAQLRGFADIPLMEDIDFSRRLRRAARTVVLDPPISTSTRHHATRGAIRTSLRNGLMIALYRAGFPPEKLHAWYYRDPAYREAPSQ
jgi:rSAM/selenodomain-associated transferase 2